MSTAIKPLTLWGGVLGPNPAKVSMILYSLEIPHEVIYVPFKEIKNPEYLKVNSNGRLPTLEGESKDSLNPFIHTPVTDSSYPICTLRTP